MRRGFTLVELSIVLVIIGLLIGGILVAQSMISTTKINAVAMQIGQFDAGVANFKTKYNYLPGDAPAFGGNGDGLLEGGYNYGGDNRIYACEMGRFWNDYDSMNYPGFNSGMGCTPSALPGVKAYINGANKNVPESKLGQSHAFFIASLLTTDGNIADTINPRNFYVILGASQLQQPNGNGQYFFASTNTPVSNSAVKPIDLLALDKKIDDGIGTTGNLLSGSISGNNDVGGVIATPLPTCSDAGTGIYTVSDIYACTPLIRIGAQTGDVQ